MVVTKGEDIILPVNFEGTPKPSSEWTKNGKKIRKSDRIKIKEEGTSTEIKIKSAEKSDDGKYELALMNHAGVVKTSCEVVVHGNFYHLNERTFGCHGYLFKGESMKCSMPQSER